MRTNLIYLAIACAIISACHNSNNTGDHESKHDHTPPGSYSVPAIEAANDSAKNNRDSISKPDLSKPKKGQNASGNKTNYSTQEAINSHNRSQVIGKNADSANK